MLSVAGIRTAARGNGKPSIRQPTPRPSSAREGSGCPAAAGPRWETVGACTSASSCYTAVLSTARSRFEHAPQAAGSRVKSLVKPYMESCI